LTGKLQRGLASPAAEEGAEDLRNVKAAARAVLARIDAHEPLTLLGADHFSVAALRALASASPAPTKPDPTHRCKVCGALWREWGLLTAPTSLWTLVSGKAGPCCDNQPMGDQIEPLTEFHRLCDPGSMGEPASPAPSAERPFQIDPAHCFCKDGCPNCAPSAPAEGGKETK
jgi:hypothetical protein